MELLVFKVTLKQPKCGGMDYLACMQSNILSPCMTNFDHVSFCMTTVLFLLFLVISFYVIISQSISKIKYNEKKSESISFVAVITLHKMKIIKKKIFQTSSL